MMPTWDSWQNSGGSHKDFDTVGGVRSNSSSADLVQKLLLKNAQQNDIAVIVVGSFSIAASILVIASILCDAIHSNNRGRYGRRS